MEKEFFRFRLRGPGSTSVLRRALRLVERDASPATVPEDGLCNDASLVGLWLTLSSQVSNPAMLCVGSAAGLVVWDPRLKPTKALEKHLVAPGPAAPQGHTLMKRLLQVRWAGGEGL
jgi:hypothetical protein